jgi:type 1 glutamine amidotransferase
LTLLLTLVGLICCNYQTVADEDNVKSEKPKMLMVTQSAGFKHPPVKRGEQLISPAEKTMKKIAHQTGLFDVDFSQDVATHLTRENLQNYDIVVFYTSGNLPIAKDDLKYLLEDWVKQPGHGFLGFHSASDTYKEHQPYWDFIGGTFDGHPWGANTKVAIKVHDPAHPAMKPFGSEFEFRDEIYQYVIWQP